jgi:hypothetical protein
MKSIKINLRSVVAIAACLAAVTMFASCDKEEDPIDTGTEQDADIVAFTFEGIDGKAAIDKTAHTVTAKAGETVDLTVLVAEFTLSKGATATAGGKTQVSKTTANNFTTPVTYQVTSGDGETTNDWTVTVTGGKTGGSGDCETELTADMVRNGGTFPKCTYIVKGVLNINADKTLTFAPGSVIKFDVGSYGVRGGFMGTVASIVAKGTEQEPIIFTGAKENGAAGDWAYLNLKNFDFEYCTIEYGGKEGGGVMNEDICSMITFSGTGSFKHCTLRESVGTGLRVNGNFTAFEYNTITGCGENVEDEYPMFAGNSTVDRGIKRLEAMGQGNVINTAKGVRVAGGVNESTVLHKLNCPYLIFGISVFGTGTTLTVEPGVQIKIGDGVAGHGDVRVDDNGTLIAQGTAADPIVISGMNNNAGNWNGIHFASNRGAGCLLEYCQITGGGYDAPVQGDAIVMVPGYTQYGCKVVTVRNCHIANSPTWGIYFVCNSNLSSSCSQTGNTFENCVIGNYPDCN